MTDGSTTTLFLLRHGRTDWNRIGRWHGQADVPLDELGVQQARAFAQLAPGLLPDVIVTSPLARARQTAAAVAGVLEVRVDVEPGLMEVDVGDWEGLVDAEVIRLDPHYERAQSADRRFSATGETPDRVRRADVADTRRPRRQVSGQAGARRQPTPTRSVPVSVPARLGPDRNPPPGWSLQLRVRGTPPTPGGSLGADRLERQPCLRPESAGR